MKFEVNSKKLFNLVNQVIKAKNKSTNNQLFNNIYIKLEENILTMRATNLEITCEKSISVKGLVNGECLITGDYLFKAINNLNNIDTNINWETDENILNLNYLKSKINLKLSNFETFPNIPKTGKLIAKINLKDYIKLIKSVSFCASTTEIKPEISSIYLYSKNNELFSVATDSFRLAEKKINFNTEEDISVLIFQKNINEKISILENVLEEIKDEENKFLEIYLFENLLSFQINNTLISIRSVNGNFPDYRQLFPKEINTKIKIDKIEIKNTLNLSTIFIDNYSYIDFEINMEEKKIKTKSKNEKIGNLEKEILIEEGEGQNVSASYNSVYFLEGINNISGENLNLSWVSSNKPMFIKDDNDESFVYLLMPLNK